MKLHFLVTVSNELENLCGVQFLCSFFEKMNTHRATLFHICRQDAGDMNRTLLETWDHPENRVNGVLTVGGKRCLDKVVKMLSDAGIDMELMKTKTVAERFGKVRDILNEGAEGLYDAIILGRRASYTLQWVFERPADETALAMISDSLVTSPLWICPKPETGRKGVLLCLDGSENSLRAADHVGYILASHIEHNITLFHVELPGNGEAEDLFTKAEKVLAEHGIDAARIQRKTSWGISIPGSILSEADSGRYGAVAIGLHGHSHGLLKSMNLSGGTTAKLINRIEGAALWCCP